MDERTENAPTTENEGPSCAVDQSCCGGAAKVASIEGAAKVARIEDGCTLNPSENPEVLARWKELFGQTLGHDAADGKAVFRFERSAALDAELQELVKLERICCAHVGWDLNSVGDETHLTLTADARALGTLVKELMSGEFGGAS